MFGEEVIKGDEFGLNKYGFINIQYTENMHLINSLTNLYSVSSWLLRVVEATHIQLHVYNCRAVSSELSDPQNEQAVTP